MATHTFTWSATDAQWSSMQHVIRLSRQHLREYGGTSKLRKKGTTYTLTLKGPGSDSVAKTIAVAVEVQNRTSGLSSRVGSLESVLKDLGVQS
jgi:hypothetical protein